MAKGKDIKIFLAVEFDPKCLHIKDCVINYYLSPRQDLLEHHHEDQQIQDETRSFSQSVNVFNRWYYSVRSVGVHSTWVVRSSYNTRGNSIHPVLAIYKLVEHLDLENRTKLTQTA